MAQDHTPDVYWTWNELTASEQRQIPEHWPREGRVFHAPYSGRTGRSLRLDQVQIRESGMGYIDAQVSA